MNCFKIWNIKMDCTNGASYTALNMVQNDTQSYLIKVKFVNNRRKLEEIDGNVFFLFTFADNTTYQDEMIDIENDEGQYVVPDNVLEKEGLTRLRIEIVNSAKINCSTEIYFTIEPDPWV